MASYATSLHALRPAVSRDIVKLSTTALPAESVRKILLLACNELLNMDAKSTLWNAPIPKPFTVSLNTLYDRLLDGKLAPTPPKLLPPEFLSKPSSRTVPAAHPLGNLQTLTSSPIRTTTLTPEERPLQDFEDLYYALLAKVQDLHHTLRLRVTNGFTPAETPIFPSGPSVVDTCAQLQYFWNVLNDPSLAKALDDAVSRARVEQLHEEIVQELTLGNMSEGTAGQFMDDLYTSFNSATEKEEQMPGLAWIGGWAPSMITAWLEEKYMALLRREKEAWEWEQREKRREKEAWEWEQREKKREIRERRKKERMEKEKEKAEKEREKAWKNAYNDPIPEWEADMLKKAFEQDADNVQEIGRLLRRSAGGKYSCDETK